MRYAIIQIMMGRQVRKPSDKIGLHELLTPGTNPSVNTYLGKVKFQASGVQDMAEHRSKSDSGIQAAAGNGANCESCCHDLLHNTDPWRRCMCTCTHGGR